MKIESSNITVVMPAYNAEKYIGEAITSIRKQSIGCDAGIIVVDDASTDKTADIASRLGAELLTRSHKGAAAARNLGITRVETDWIFLLDADDTADEKAFENLSTALDADICAVFGLAKDFISPELNAVQAAAIAARPKPYRGILPGCSLIRTETFRKIGPFNEKLSPGEVVDWMIRFRESGIPSKEIPVVTLNRRLHLTNSGRVSKKTEAANYAAILRRRIMNERKG